MSLLHRIGSKRAIADKIIPYFPPHDLYIEMFFGAGGMFFKKPKAKYNICNDLDSDVFNLFMILQDEEKKKQLYDYMKLVPVHQDLLKYWKVHKETDAIKKAGRFLFLTNYTYLSSKEILNFNCENYKQILLDRLECCDDLSNVFFMNNDFRNVIKSIRVKNKKPRTFIYADPPYLDTGNNYENCKWKEQDTADLFNVLVNSGIRFAMSEFDNPKVIAMAENYNLNINVICERKNLKNRRTEILITNYKNENEKRNDLF